MKYIIVFFCIFNIVAWIVFLKKFKKLFTTDNIIEETKSEYNKLVADFNKNTEMNITILDERIRTLRAMTVEADKKIKLLNDIEKKGFAVSELQNAINGKSTPVQRKISDAYSKSKSPRKDIASDASFEVTQKGVKETQQDQKTLFDEENDSVNTLDTKAKINVNEKGDAWTEVPVVVPEVYVPEVPVLHKKDKKSQIVAMFDAGMSVEEIAAELKLTDTEVQFALSMEDRI